MSPNEPNEKTVKTPRELQFDQFLAAVEENGDQQALGNFRAAFSEIVKPLHPGRPDCAMINASREARGLSEPRAEAGRDGSKSAMSVHL